VGYGLVSVPGQPFPFAATPPVRQLGSIEPRAADSSPLFPGARTNVLRARIFCYGVLFLNPANCARFEEPRPSSVLVLVFSSVTHETTTPTGLGSSISRSARPSRILASRLCYSESVAWIFGSPVHATAMITLLQLILATITSSFPLISAPIRTARSRAALPSDQPVIANAPRILWNRKPIEIEYSRLLSFFLVFLVRLTSSS
jgi:hypothetical protein